MPFKGGKTWGARAGGRQSHPPPVWKRSEARLISRGHSAEEAPPEKWAMRMFTPHSTYPPWAVMGLPCYFCTPSPYWTAVKDCVGYSRHMAFPSICRQRAEPVAERVDLQHPSHPPGTGLPHPFKAMASVMTPLPQRHPDHFPSHSHSAGTPIPSCQSQQQHAWIL